MDELTAAVHYMRMFFSGMFLQLTLCYYGFSLGWSLATPVRKIGFILLLPVYLPFLTLLVPMEAIHFFVHVASKPTDERWFIRGSKGLGKILLWLPRNVVRQINSILDS